MNQHPLLFKTMFVVFLSTILIFCTTENRNEHANQSNRQLAQLSLKVEPRIEMGDNKPSTLQLPDDIHLLSALEYENLSIFYITGSPTLNDKDYVTLEEAMEKELVKLYETGTVSQLQIDNLSGEYIYINSGDIVKGGKQDRTIQYDVILPPKAKHVDLASFCVERGRWSQREGESVGTFSISANSLSSNELKIATKRKKDQSEVWSKVDRQQDRLDSILTYNYGITEGSVYDEVSATSLDLSLENKHIDSLKTIYKKELDINFNKHKDVIGFAFFINGEFHALDVYNNHGLFLDLKNKLLESAITEAISKIENNKENKPFGDYKIIETYLNDLYRPEKYEILNEATIFSSHVNDSNKNVFAFTCTDNDAESWLHHNIIREL